MSASMDGTPLAQDNRTLISNLDRLHTTVMGTERIKRNLNIETDAVAYCKALILKRNCVIYQQGKELILRGGWGAYHHSCPKLHDHHRTYRKGSVQWIAMRNKTMEIKLAQTQDIHA